MRWGNYGLLRASPFLIGSDLTEPQMESIAKYLSRFGPDTPKLALRPPEYPVDENVVSKAIFVQYDLPDPLSESRRPVMLHSAMKSSDNKVWLTGGTNVLKLDPKELDPAERTGVYPIEAGGSTHGLSEDRRGHVFYADLGLGKVGDIDPKSGKVIEWSTATKGFTHTIFTDSHGYIWYSDISSSALGKYDPATGRLESFQTKTPAAGPYGMVEDVHGNIWAACLTKGIILKFNPDTYEMTEYNTPTPGSGPRRIIIDSKGVIWFAESSAERFGSINSETGEMKEYKLPITNVGPYSVWFDKKDEKILWGNDMWNSYSVFRYDVRTNRMVYYPAPPGTYGPEVAVDPDNTVWMGVSAANGGGAIHFYPNGYSANAAALP